MKKLLILIGFLLVALYALATETEQIIAPKESGSTVIRALTTDGVYIFTNNSERPVAVTYARVLSSGEVSGNVVSTYTRALTFRTNRIDVVETDYTGATVTNKVFGNVDGSTYWTNTVSTAVTGTEFNVDFNDDLLLLVGEKLTITMPETTNTYYLDIRATKE